MFNVIMDITKQGMKDRALAKQVEHMGFGGVGSSLFLHFVDTSYEFGDPRAQTIWSEAVYEYGLQNMFYTPFLGSKRDPNALIVMESKLETQKGGTIIFEARNVLEGGGQGDDQRTTGNEQQITRRNMFLPPFCLGA